MASTSCSELAAEVLEQCLRGEPDLPPRLLEQACSAELFRVVVEGLADRFEPRLCEVYAALFSQVFAPLVPGVDLLGRYRRVRVPRPVRGEPGIVYVLSRVTLGADVAITSVMLDAAKKRFPRARIVFVGSRKAWEMFARDPRIELLETPYPRGGTLEDRIEPWRGLRLEGGIVVDPDSRLTQLGLLPVCAEENYYFFESRVYGGDGRSPLGALAREWAAEVFGVEATAFLAVRESAEPADVAVSLGVGDNPAKRVADPFERDLLRDLVDRGLSVLVDKGAGGEETERVRRAIEGLPVRTWEGAFAPFAGAIARSKLYVGYDSAGQHVAAASGTPLISVFKGFACERMFQRWRPSGPGRIEVVPGDLAAVTKAIEALQ